MTRSRRLFPMLLPLGLLVAYAIFRATVSTDSPETAPGGGAEASARNESTASPAYPRPAREPAEAEPEGPRALRDVPRIENAPVAAEPSPFDDPGAAPPSLPARRPAPSASSVEREAIAHEVGAYLDGMRREAHAEAARLGYPLRTRDAEGRILELVAVRDGQPVYRTTFNATGAAAARVTPLLRSRRDDPDYDLSGHGVTVGVWDQARVLDFHREFDDRRVLNRRQDPFYSHHSTHVAGTIAARGARSQARGMAPGARIDAFNWNQALAEMATYAPLFPGEPDTLTLGNHSYGLVAGWFFLGEEDAFVFTGFDRFGRYDEFAYLTDIVAHAFPYQLSVWAAGNHRAGDPRPGDPVLIDGRRTPYNPDIHPPGDGVYKRGFDTINSFQIAKNVLTIGAVDYSTIGERSSDINDARMTAFSSWGPSDDGRIKPDLVAHGVDLMSPIALEGWYARASGTSMAAPTVTGTLALLTEYFSRHYPGHALRAATKRALLVHTADDLGNPGPDYRYGWGLLNAHGAAAVLADYAQSPRPNLLVEDFLSTGRTATGYTVASDGEGPLSVTLAWTDPPAPGPVSESDAREPVLVNNLNLTVNGPDGLTAYLPYRLNPEAPAAPATTGTNDVDNVLRIDLAAPHTPGTYTVNVDHAGDLFGDEQAFSLVVTASEPTATTPAPPSVATVHPPTGSNGGTEVLEVRGNGFLLGTNLRLSRPGEDPIDAFGVESTPERIRARFDLYGAAPGSWDLQVEAPDGETATFETAFDVQSDCHFTLDPEVFQISHTGGYFTARLDSSSPHCEWTLTSSEDWLLFLTPRTGSGDTDVIYSVDNHSGSAVPRSANIRVNGRPLLTVNQDGAPPVTLQNGVPRADFITGRERQTDWKYFRFDVPHLTAGTLEILLDSLTADADLYVRYGEKPTRDAFDCRPLLGGIQEEFCQFANPQPGTWWIGINNWETGRIDYVISAGLDIQVLAYDDWARNVFTPEELEQADISAPGADPGGFGISNLLRYGLGLDPRTPDRARLPQAGIMEDGENEYLYIEYTIIKAAVDANFQVQESDDLENWTPFDGIAETTGESATTQTVRLRSRDPLTSAKARFLRLQATLD